MTRKSQRIRLQDSAMGMKKKDNWSETLEIQSSDEESDIQLTEIETAKALAELASSQKVQKKSKKSAMESEEKGDQKTEKAAKKKKGNENQTEAGSSKEAMHSTPVQEKASKNKDILYVKGKKSGKDSIRNSWFLNPLMEAKWMKGYASAKLAFCSELSPDLLKKLDFASLKLLKGSAFKKMINKGSVAYPGVTTMFYLN